MTWEVMARMKKQSKRAVLVLEDGRTFQGTAFGAEGEALGEVVFNTSMTGYQEIVTDPSYNEQLITFTCPHIGNVGVTAEDVESSRVQAAGVIVREASPVYSNWRADKSFDDYLTEQNTVGIQGIDTRALTLHIREKGAMKGIISSADFNYESLMNKLNRYPGLVGQDLVKHVTTRDSYIFNPDQAEAAAAFYEHTIDRPEDLAAWRERQGHDRHYVVALDCGIKTNMLRILSYFNCSVIVVPAGYDYARIMCLNPDGIFLSNGPGDPEGVPYVVKTVQQLLEHQPELPVFGICLGHQILGLAFGGRTYKLKFGHRGANHPAMDLATGKIEITTQNHGFCVAGGKDEQGRWRIEGCPELEVTHVNLNDQTVEGFRHRTRPVFCVQYHPESSAGPHDSWYLFRRFIGLIEEHKAAMMQQAV